MNTGKDRYDAPETLVLEMRMESSCLSVEAQKNGGESDWDDL